MSSISCVNHLAIGSHGTLSCERVNASLLFIPLSISLSGICLQALSDDTCVVRYVVQRGAKKSPFVDYCTLIARDGHSLTVRLFKCHNFVTFTSSIL
jgi:hypothetical protein